VCVCACVRACGLGLRTCHSEFSVDFFFFFFFFFFCLRLWDVKSIAYIVVVLTKYSTFTFTFHAYIQPLFLICSQFPSKISQTHNPTTVCIKKNVVSSFNTQYSLADKATANLLFACYIRKPYSILDGNHLIFAEYKKASGALPDIIYLFI
jgi:hypothetical protein